MSIAAFDHVAIPTERPEEMLSFYRALGFCAPTPEEWKASGVPAFSLQLGEQKINVHAPALWRSSAFTLRAPAALPGCGDFCFVWSADAEALQAMLRGAGAKIEEGPVARVGGRNQGSATGVSYYTRDPDGNLLEFIIYP
jgi:catechol 2,3-dioxygenase-like lactoylglutathione lyase family enzyme